MDTRYWVLRVAVLRLASILLQLYDNDKLVIVSAGKVQP